MKTDPRALKLFLAVCREGTISGAARSQHLSQPSVSVAISQLERVLDTKLFERRRTGIELTPAGEALHRRAQAMEHLLIAAEREVQLVTENITGPLVIGGTPGALATVVPKALKLLLSEYPKLDIRIIERKEPSLHELLRTYQLDLAVCTTAMNECPEDLEELTILSDSFSLLAGEQNSQLPSEISLTDLQEVQWVLPDAQGSFRRQIDTLFIQSGIPMPANVIRSDSLLTTKTLVRDTRCITILPDYVANAELAAGQLRAIKIKETGVQRNIGLLWLKERANGGILQSVIDLLKASH
ncbi:LysR family transcriptional regulator [Halioxenophilus aromaticivorans]|uniref:LysR family transcriptional regulator n=1 Tax=Halioxenophilus aromaticivorans TaxID=1306992 RepID=A0AAV3U3L9_9ALTE